MVSCSMPDDDRDLLAVTGDGGRAPLRRSGEKDLALRLSSDLQPIPRTLDDFDAGARQPSDARS